MATTLQQMRIIAPQFTSDDACNLALEYAAKVNKVAQWGTSLYETACVYYALHLLATWERGSTGAAGPTTFAKVGEWSQQFGFIEQSPDAMNSTVYGQQYLRLIATRRPVSRFMGVPAQ